MTQKKGMIFFEQTGNYSAKFNTKHKEISTDNWPIRSTAQNPDHYSVTQGYSPRRSIS